MDTIWIILLTILGVLAVLTAIAAFVWWRVRRSVKRQVLNRISELTFREKFNLAGELFTDHRVPGLPRLVLVALVIYLALPIDLIPDFIPFLGLVDDVVVLAVGAGLLIWWLPKGLLEEHISRIEDNRIRTYEGKAEPPRALNPPGARPT